MLIVLELSSKDQMGKWQLITDLSFLEGSSVNDGIDANACSFNYIAVQQVAHKA